ncbi:MAG: hypothetical protein IJS66_05590, partial [Bacteroidales bacterium]|nr:hypothetical protein [Bacteroidales bacterium]
MKVRNPFLLLLAIFLFAPARHACAQGLFRPKEGNMHVCAPAVPAYVVFAGDTIRFDTPERY